ncbi:MAG: hypothetical protein H0U99_06390, partial [Chthoniobacterales bacterium]|nr:hypothetical protein [Chthoniobacterales bacterium]
EHRKVEEQDGRVQAQEATIAELKSAVAKQQATGAQQKNDLEARIAQQRNDFQARVTQQQKQIEALAAGLAKGRPACRTRQA